MLSGFVRMSVFVTPCFKVHCCFRENKYMIQVNTYPLIVCDHFTN